MFLHLRSSKLFIWRVGLLACIGNPVLRTLFHPPAVHVRRLDWMAEEGVRGFVVDNLGFHDILHVIHRA